MMVTGDALKSVMVRRAKVRWSQMTQKSSGLVSFDSFFFFFYPV